MKHSSLLAFFITIILFTFLLLLLLFVSGASSASSSKLKNLNTANMVVMDRQASVMLLMHTHKPAFLLFSANWCSRCLTIHKRWEQFANRTKGAIRVGVMDAGRFGETAKKGYKVEALPAILFWPAGSKSGLRGQDYFDTDEFLLGAGKISNLESFANRLVLKGSSQLHFISFPSLTTVAELNDKILEIKKKLYDLASSTKRRKVFVLFTTSDAQKEDDEQLKKEREKRKKQDEGEEEQEGEEEDNSNNNDHDDDDDDDTLDTHVEDSSKKLELTFRILSSSPFYKNQLNFDIIRIGQGDNSITRQVIEKVCSSSSSQIVSTREDGELVLFSLPESNNNNHQKGTSDEFKCEAFSSSSSSSSSNSNLYDFLARFLHIHSQPQMISSSSSSIIGDKKRNNCVKMLPVRECPTLGECMEKYPTGPFVVRKAPEISHLTLEWGVEAFSKLNSTRVGGITISGDPDERIISHLLSDWLQSSDDDDEKNHHLDINIFNDEIAGLLGKLTNKQMPKVFDEFDADFLDKSKNYQFVGSNRKVSPLFTYKAAYTGLHVDPPSEGGGWQYLFSGKKYWQFISPKRMIEFYEKGDVQPQDYRDGGDCHKEKEVLEVYETFLNSGDTLMFGAGYLHRVWTLEKSFGLVSYLTLKGSEEFRKESHEYYLQTYGRRR